MAYKEGDKVFVPVYLAGAGVIEHEDGTLEHIEPDFGYWHTLTKEEADERNRRSELFGKWAEELKELIKGDN